MVISVLFLNSWLNSKLLDWHCQDFTYFTANKLVCHSFMDADRRTGDSWIRDKGFITLSSSGSMNFTFTPILLVSQVPSVQFSSVQSLSRVQLFATPWITARQASMSITNSRSSPRLTSIESVMPSSHLILCRALLLLPSIFPSIRVFSNESTLHMRWPKYWSFSFSIIPSKEIPGLPQMISVLEFSPQLLWGTVASQESLSYGTYHSLQ